MQFCSGVSINSKKVFQNGPRVYYIRRDYNFTFYKFKNLKFTKLSKYISTDEAIARFQKLESLKVDIEQQLVNYCALRALQYTEEIFLSV